jgi:hypothetical protein
MEAATERGATALLEGARGLTYFRKSSWLEAAFEVVDTVLPALETPSPALKESSGGAALVALALASEKQPSEKAAITAKTIPASTNRPPTAASVKVAIPVLDQALDDDVT